MPRSSWLSNPWALNPWFETVAVAQRRAKKRLPSSVYGALVAGSERGLSADDNTAAFAELGFAPHIAGHKPERDMSTTVMGLPVSLPVIISPTGVQAVHPDGEVAVARAAADRGIRDGPQLVRQQVHRGGRRGQPEDPVPDVLDRRPRRHGPAHGARPGRRRQGPHRHARLVVLHRPRLGQPGDPGEDRPEDDDPARAAGDHQAARGCGSSAGSGTSPTSPPRTWPPPGGKAPTFFDAYYEWMTTPPPTLGRRRVAAQAVGRAVHGQGRVPGRRRQARGRRGRAPPSRCPTTAATTSTAPPPPIRVLKPIADAVGDQVEVVWTAASGEARTSSRPSRSAPARC